jgi:hypothetical protein
MLGELRSIAGQCDGVRCDMAMLVLPDVIARTWGARSLPSDGTPPVDDSFWPWAITSIRNERPGFVFMAEAYWDMEWTLQQQGFDYTYDKRLYDRLRSADAGRVRGHLHADPDYQRRSVRFLENHDEPRAAAIFEQRVHEAAAVIALLAPGLRFVHEGQQTGRRFTASNHLRRRAMEPVDRGMESFYGRLLGCMRRQEVRDGHWQLLDAAPAWSGNQSFEQFVAFSWEKDGQRAIVAVNYGPREGQCYLRLPYPDIAGTNVELRDQLDATTAYMRSGDDLLGHGLYLDVAPWRHHVFSLQAQAGVRPS